MSRVPVTRMQAIRTAARLADEMKKLHQHAAGAMLGLYVCAMRAGGELRITPTEIVNATGGKVRVSHSESGEWIISAMPDTSQREMTTEEMAEYAKLVEQEEAAQQNGTAPHVPDPPALEGDDVLSRP